MKMDELNMVSLINNGSVSSDLLHPFSKTSRILWRRCTGYAY